jgi:hypothetical protein
MQLYITRRFYIETKTLTDVDIFLTFMAFINPKFPGIRQKKRRTNCCCTYVIWAGNKDVTT